MIRRCELPDDITLPTGATLKAVIGGHLEQKPFLTVVDVTRNGWSADLPVGVSEEAAIIAEARRRRLKYRRVAVLSRNLRRSLDLHGRPYRPSVWIFVEVPKTASGLGGGFVVRQKVKDG